MDAHIAMNIVVTIMSPAFLFVAIIAAWCMVENGRLEKELRERTVEFQHRIAENTRLLADVSHEFRTPLSILRANIAILARGTRGEKTAARRVAETTLVRLSRLVDSLLESERLSFYEETFYKELVDVKRLIEEARDDCAILGENKKIELSAVSEKFFVLGNKDALKEVLLNLISNALKHTDPGGSIRLTARVVPTEEREATATDENPRTEASRRAGIEGPAAAEIVVVDTGHGIPAGNLENIFERFYKIDKASAEGTGLGLHICRRIVEAHGGTIVAESEVGAGSRFVIRLPLADENLWYN